MANPYADGGHLRLASRHVRRSAYLDTTAEALAAYLGICENCPRPVRAEVPFAKSGGLMYTKILCPDCARPLKAEKLFAVTNQLDCDSSCLSAWGPACSCGCGGVNHGKHWGMKLSESEVLEHELVKYREHRDKVTLAAVQRELEKRRVARERKAAMAARRSGGAPW